MSFDNPFASGPEKVPPARVEVELEFRGFVPQEFLSEPISYFEREGTNIKRGEVKLDDEGKVREDPTAVKDLPTRRNQQGDELRVVGRRVNTLKGDVGKSGNPFYEYKILEKLRHMNLPAARPIAKAEQGETHIIVMERIPGIRWSEKEDLQLRERGYSDEDITSLQTQAEQKMEELHQRFESAGVIRGWKLKDMVFQIDIENKKVLAVIPTDWERTRIEEKISEFEDLRGLDLSERNLKAVSSEMLATVDFDTKTIWPPQDKLPNGFNPEKVIEEGKNPGLGIRKLHQEGIDGRGIRVAIIDQTLSSEQGEFMPHAEYARNIVDYKEYGGAKDEDVSMHGPAVASLLVGGTCGVAPGAELVYKATSSGRAFELRARALMDIVESNKTAEPDKKVRIVSCSIGYQERNPEPGLEEWIDAIKKAEEEGIVIVDVSHRNGIRYHGGGTAGDKENINEYDRALFLAGMDGYDKEDPRWSEVIIVPSDYRTMASNAGQEEYMYNGKGGMSWSVPYLAGLFALALQVNPDITREEIADAIHKTASMNKKGLKIVNPRGFIEAVKK